MDDRTVYHSRETDQNGFVAWTDIENRTWQTLFERQSQAVTGRASDIFTRGVELLEFDHKIPQIPELNKKLLALNGWSVSPVPALIQPQEFYELMAQKKFPAATFIRVPEDLDYIMEPDIFHEIYGHTPLLTCPTITTFMYEFAKFALSADKKYRRKLFRLFWFTIEFGMIKENGFNKALGAGILSSIGETKFCMTNECVHKRFKVKDVLRTPYRIDIMQPLYYVLDNIEDLLNVLDENLFSLIDETATLGDYDPLFDPVGLTLDTDSGTMGDPQ
jgi:phenylalanine-4-hydroxylase